MEWTLIVSIIFNIILLLAVISLIIDNKEGEATISTLRSELRNWTDLFFEVQDKLQYEHQLFLSKNGGKYGNLCIEYRKDTTAAVE